MDSREGPQSYIRTPIELDMAFRALERHLEQSASPIRNFSLLTDFLSHTEALPRPWLTSYGTVLVRRVSRLAEHVYISGGEPERWNIILRFLDAACEYGWFAHREQFDRIRDVACGRMIFAHACVRAFRALHGYLCMRRFRLRELSEADWSAISNADTLGHDAFVQYVRRAVPPEIPVPVPIDSALQQWRHAREEGGVGVVLLDASDNPAMDSGTVLRLDVRSRPSSAMHVHFTSEIAPDNTETQVQLERGASLAADLVRRSFSTPPPREYHFSFHDRGAEFRGASMGLGAALLMIIDMQRGFNREVRWHLAAHMACSGGLNADGSVQQFPSDVLRRKVAVAFFSPVDRLVIAAAQREEALRIVRSLQQRYPARQLDVHGIETLGDCADADGVIRHERRAISDRVFEFSRRHAVALLIFILLLLGGYTGFLLWKYYYDYPNLEQAQGKIPEASSIVYNPKDEVSWTFRDGDEHKSAIVPFGDLEIGDGCFRNFYIYNFGRFPLELDITVESDDDEEWYCNWNGGQQQIASTEKLRMMVMFAPVRPGRMKTARLVLRDAGSGEERYVLALHGSAGPPQPAGYAMQLDGMDDMLVFGEKSYAFGMDDATVEMWLRPDTLAGCFYSNTYNPPDGQAIENMAFTFSHDTLHIGVASIGVSVRIPEEANVRAGEWMHFALTYRHPREEGPGRVTALCNGVVVFDREDEFIMENIFRPYVSVGAYHNGFEHGGHFRGAVDEIRLWRGYRSADEIRATMRQRVDARAPGLRGYWDMDHVTEESINVAYKSAQEAEPYGRPAPVRSAAPVTVSEAPPVRSVEGPLDRPATELAPFCYLHCAQQLMESDSARSYALWYRHDGPEERVMMAVSNQDAWIQVLSDGVAVGEGPYRDVRVREGWNHVALRVARDGTLDYFLNGSFVKTITSETLARGPFFRYYGLQLGFFYDGYNHLRTKYFDSSYGLLSNARAVADFCVWERRLEDAEIAALYRGSIPEEGLLAHWPLDSAPDATNNFPDVLHGHLMHLRRIRAWE